MKFFCGAIYKSFEYILLNLWTQLEIFRTWWKEWHFLFSAAATWLNFQRQNLAFSGQRCKYGNTSSASQKDIRITTRICKYWTSSDRPIIQSFQKGKVVNLKWVYHQTACWPLSLFFFNLIDTPFKKVGKICIALRNEGVQWTVRTRLWYNKRFWISRGGQFSGDKLIACRLYVR